MRFLESLIYGLISGLAEFLPVSTQAHQVLCMQIFGTYQREPIRDLFVHIALIAALLTAGSSLFNRISREQKLSRHAGRGKLRQATARTLLDLRLVRTAAVPMLLLMLLYLAFNKWEAKPVVVAIILIFNGLVLILPEYMRHGNKDARSISRMEAILIGIASGISALPGMSRIAGCVSASTACGADKSNSVNWALLLSLPALVLFVLFDFVNLIVLGTGGMTFLVFLGYLVSALTAYVGGYFSIMLFRFLSEKAGFGAFAYYSWGAALLLFILYLIT